MRRFRFSAPSGKHWLDWLPMLVIALVIFLGAYSVVNGLLNSRAEYAHAKPKQVDMSHGQAAYQGWYEDAAGYQQALAEHIKTKKPIIVYFYAPWCGYCANFHQKLLSNPKVIAAMKDYVKVRSYPENGAAERQMMSDFGADGFPTVFIKSADEQHFRRVNMHGPDGELLSPDDFIQKLKMMAIP